MNIFCHSVEDKPAPYLIKGNPEHKNRIGGFLPLLIILSMIIICFNVSAQESSCPLSLLEKADRSISKLNNWQDIYESFKRFRQCDDGYIAEGYSDAVVKTLAHKWHQINILIKLASEDKNFYAFVISHIDATTDESELEIVTYNSSKRCPKSATNICNDIEKAAKEALREIM